MYSLVWSISFALIVLCIYCTFFMNFLLIYRQRSFYVVQIQESCVISYFGEPLLKIKIIYWEFYLASISKHVDIYKNIIYLM